MIFDFHLYCSVIKHSFLFLSSVHFTTCHMLMPYMLLPHIASSIARLIFWIRTPSCESSSIFFDDDHFSGGKKLGNLSDSVSFRAELCALWHLSFLSLSVEVWDDFRVSCIVSESQRFGHLNATLPQSSHWCFYYTCRHGDQHPLPHILLHL